MNVDQTLSLDCLFSLKNNIAIVTGGSKGIGQKIATRLAQYGAKVVVSSRNYKACEQVANTICSLGGEAIAFECDISKKEDLQKLVNHTVKVYGRIDSLVCNAALVSGIGPSLKTTDNVYDDIMNTNARGNFWLCNMVVPIMKQDRGGSIIVISSISGFTGSTKLAAYSMSKSVNLQMVKNLAVEFGKFNIRANCISPGLVKTESTKIVWNNGNILRKNLNNIPLGRICEPDDIAGAVVFLASNAASYISGQNIIIDGGRTSGFYLLNSTEDTNNES